MKQRGKFIIFFLICLGWIVTITLFFLGKAIPVTKEIIVTDLACAVPLSAGLTYYFQKKIKI